MVAMKKVRCSRCGKSGNVKADINLAKAKCPNCKSTGTFKPVMEIEKVKVEVLKTEAQKLTTCPFCKEEIRPDAHKCKHCGEILKATPKSNPSQMSVNVNIPFHEKSANPNEGTFKGIGQGLLLK